MKNLDSETVGFLVFKHCLRILERSGAVLERISKGLEHLHRCFTTKHWLRIQGVARTKERISRYATFPQDMEPRLPSVTELFSLTLVSYNENAATPLSIRLHNLFPISFYEKKK